MFGHTHVHVSELPITCGAGHAAHLQAHEVGSNVLPCAQVVEPASAVHSHESVPALYRSGGSQHWPLGPCCGGQPKNSEQTTSVANSRLVDFTGPPETRGTVPHGTSTQVHDSESSEFNRLAHRSA